MERARSSVRHTREELLERTVREFEALDVLVRSLRDQEWRLLARRRPGQDPWTLQDVLVHITYWKADVARFALGKSRPAGERGLGTHEHNRLVFDRWRDRRPADVLAYHRQVQEDVMVALREASESWISGRERAPHWPADLDIHSAAHRVRDIERVLREAGVVLIGTPGRAYTAHT